MCNQQISRYWLLVTRPNFMSIGLGRGLSSLIPEKILPPEKTKDPDFTWEAGDNEVLITEIKPNPNQPRKDLDPEKLLELSRSNKKAWHSSAFGRQWKLWTDRRAKEIRSGAHGGPAQSAGHHA